MDSFATWLLDLLATRVPTYGSASLLEKRLRELEESHERYLDAARWADLRGVGLDSATEELEDGVERGLLEKVWLYEGEDTPVDFVVPTSALGKAVLLSDMGIFEGEQDREIIVSPHRSRPVYVSALG